MIEGLTEPGVTSLSPGPHKALHGLQPAATDRQRVQLGTAMSRSLLTNPYLLVLPGLLFAAFIILWPLVQLGQISLSDVKRFGQLRGFTNGTT